MQEWGGVAALVVLGLLLGCSENDGSLITGDAEGAPREIAAEPRLALGVTAGDTLQEFHRVATPFLLPDDRIVVPLRSDGVLRIFDEEGEFLESLGGAGEGPGEFVGLRAAWPRGDTIEAVDSRLRRVTRFLPDGGIEVISLEGDGPVETVVPGAWAEGWVTMGIAGAGHGFRDEIVLHGFSMEEGPLGELGRVEGMKRISGSGVAGPHPLSPRAVYRIGRGELFVAETETPRIQVWSPEGAVMREFEWEARDRSSRSAAMAIVRASPNLEWFYEALIADAEVPDRLSIFWDFLVDELGFLWIREYEPELHASALAD